jgi:hypothetical protein
MWVEGEAFAGINIVKTGTIDDKEVLRTVVSIAFEMSVSSCGIKVLSWC